MRLKNIWITLKVTCYQSYCGKFYYYHYQENIYTWFSIYKYRLMIYAVYSLLFKWKARKHAHTYILYTSTHTYILYTSTHTYILYKSTHTYVLYTSTYTYWIYNLSVANYFLKDVILYFILHTYIGYIICLWRIIFWSMLSYIVVAMSMLSFLHDDLATLMRKHFFEIF